MLRVSLWAAPALAAAAAFVVFIQARERVGAPIVVGSAPSSVVDKRGDLDAEFISRGEL